MSTEHDPSPEFLPARFSETLSKLQEEVEEVFIALIERPWGRSAASRTGWPAIDLYDTDDSFLVLADLPGVAPEDIELRVEGRDVTLCGLRWNTGFMRRGRVVVIERNCGRFCRTFALDSDVDLERLEQGCENGIYWARLPKKEQAKESPEH